MEFDPNDQWASVEIPETLVGRRAGGSAADKARGLREEQPVVSRLLRLAGVHTDEAAWRQGAAGERATAFWLDRLQKRGWHVFHDVPIGARGANVDHIVIGPGGVFSINAKYSKGKVWVAGGTFMVNGRRRDYVRSSEREAERVASKLSTVVGRPVVVHPIIAVYADDITVKEQPRSVRITTVRGAAHWIKQQRPTLAMEEVTQLAGAASRPATWL
jgi:hypothetical protein